MNKFIGCLWMNFIQIIINLVETNVVWFLNSKGTFDLDFFFKLFFDGALGLVLRLVFWNYKIFNFSCFHKEFIIDLLKTRFDSISITHN